MKLFDFSKSESCILFETEGVPADYVSFSLMYRKRDMCQDLVPERQ